MTGGVIFIRLMRGIPGGGGGGGGGFGEARDR